MGEIFKSEESFIAIVIIYLLIVYMVLKMATYCRLMFLDIELHKRLDDFKKEYPKAKREDIDIKKIPNIYKGLRFSGFMIWSSIFIFLCGEVMLLLGY